MPQPPILFNRLGNSTQTTKSVIGVNGVEAAVITYNNVKFGSGASDSAAGAGITFNNVPVAFNKGCIEFWIKTTQTPAAQVNMSPVGEGEAAQTFPEIRVYWVDSLNQLIYIMATSSGVFAQLRITAANMGWTGAGDVIHWAFGWDATGGSGAIAKGSDVLYVYVNGSAVSSFALDNTVGGITYENMQGASKTNKLGICGENAGNYGCNATVDNIKIYNYAKTDFSDRENERGGLDDQVI